MAALFEAYITNLGKSIPATDWNEQTKAEEWRAAWAQLCNQALEQNGHAERVDHRSYEQQGIDQIPTVHLGVAACGLAHTSLLVGDGDDLRVQDNHLISNSLWLLLEIEKAATSKIEK